MTAATGPGNAEQVAIFIDFENLAIGAANSLPDQANPVPYAALELVYRDYSNASIRRAYADWAKSQFGKYQHDLLMNSVDLVQIQQFGIQQKYATASGESSRDQSQTASVDVRPRTPSFSNRRLPSCVLRTNGRRQRCRDGLEPKGKPESTVHVGCPRGALALPCAW
ncbi:NYN domain-containing protein [Amycolatopsis eburnea]|uniref:NYN domain-containing protein n=1 Tax=Amycolatopsis eburnea TaxID=2267691 RepID=A0A3R9EPZ5_9PSEU|nr:NYN domain-containing protein [Amycolatopsis eburnea]